MKVENRSIIACIGAGKLLKGLVFTAFAAGLFNLRDDILDHVQSLGEALALPPEKLSTWLGTVQAFVENQHNGMRWFAALLALLYFIEGIGLMMNKRWAEWMAVIVTSSFLPIEIFETLQHFAIAKLVIIAVNAAIVAYLALVLRSAHIRNQLRATASAHLPA